MARRSDKKGKIAIRNFSYLIFPLLLVHYLETASLSTYRFNRIPTEPHIRTNLSLKTNERDKGILKYILKST